MMKKILVPTDFSENAENALNYAAELSSKMKSEITLFHVYYIPVPATDVPVVFLTEKEVRDEAELKLANAKGKFAEKYSNIKIITKAILGLSTDEIIEEAIDGAHDLIVMGTLGAGGISGFLIGTNTSSIVSNATCPVLAVPNGVKYSGIKKIVFAANYGVDDFENVFEAIDWAKSNEAELILLHVATGNLNEAVEFAEIQGFKEQVERESQYEKISFRLLKESDVYNGINLFLEDIGADLLIINKRNRSFVEGLFSRSLTRRMVIHSHIPLLVFHTDI